MMKHISFKISGDGGTSGQDDRLKKSAMSIYASLGAGRDGLASTDQAAGSEAS